MRKCILHAVWNAQGKGCAPGAVGVCVGGDRTSGYTHAKEQLFRTLDDVNPDPRLAELEASIMSTVNDLEIGTMGFGGKVTLIGCKIGALNRLPGELLRVGRLRLLGVPASRRRARTRPAARSRSGCIAIRRIRSSRCSIRPASRAPGKEVALRAPLSEADVRALKVGDVVMISGRMFTGRDAVHSHLMKHEPPVGSARLGALPLRPGGREGPGVASGWRVTAAGPTTSIREEPYQGEIIKRYGVRAVIGKGGMGAKTLAALKEHGAVYLNAIGGAAQFYARAIKTRGRRVAARVRHARSDVASRRSRTSRRS